ncbi:MAG TPA: hypothetical protein VGB83_10550 [Actinomycetota bacterium]
MSAVILDGVGRLTENGVFQAVVTWLGDPDLPPSSEVVAKGLRMVGEAIINDVLPDLPDPYRQSVERNLRARGILPSSRKAHRKSSTANG